MASLIAMQSMPHLNKLDGISTHNELGKRKKNEMITSKFKQATMVQATASRNIFVDLNSISLGFDIMLVDIELFKRN